MREARHTPGSQTSLREANRGRVVEAVKRHGGLTQIELAGATGLSPATVSNIVKELTASGVLNTSPSTHSGRRAQRVTLAHAGGLVAGIHFATRHMRLVVADVTSEVLAEQHMPLAMHHRADNELDKAAMLLADMLDSVDGALADVLAVGIAIAAPVDARRGMVARTGIMRGWDGVDVADVMQRRLQRPVHVESASSLNALAEFRYGAARGLTNSLTLDVGHSIGVGMVLDGQLHRGHSGLAGELGHVSVRGETGVCICGRRGCLDTVAGTPALLAALLPTHGPMKAGDIVVRAMAGDAACVRAIGDSGHAIGLALGDLCNLLDPERIVVNGELARAGELLLGPLRRALESNLVVAGAAPEVVPGQFGVRSPVMGATAYAIDRAVQFASL